MEISALSKSAQIILKSLAGRRKDSEGYIVINKGDFNDMDINIFFAALEELKQSDVCVFDKDYTYTPYQNFGDMTTKQYAKLDILIKETNENN